MPTLAEIRQQYPQYGDMSDGSLADALYKKFYSDMPRSDFDQRVGLSAPTVDAPKTEQTTTGIQRASIDFQNQGAASGQRTTPNMAAQSKNLLSSEVHEDEEGNAWFRDTNGQMVKADSAKHVILTDPADNKLKAFARSEDTNEGTLSSLGRLAMTGMGAGQPTKLASQGPVLATRPGQMVAEAAGRIGVELPRAVTSDMPGIQQIGKTATAIPFGGTPLRNASQGAIDQIEQSAQSTRAAYGSGSTSGAGNAVREGITDYVTAGPLKQRVTDLYNRVDDLVDPTATGPLLNTQRLADTIKARRVNAALPESSTLKDLETALARPTGMNYEGVKDLRTYFGEMLDGSTPIPQGMSHGEVKQVYGALTQDMKLIIAKAGGKDGLAAFERANRAAERWAGIRQDVGRLLKVQSEEGIFDKIMGMASSSSRADINLLGRVRGAIGVQNWDEVASAAIAKMGYQPGGTGFSSDAFLTAYNKLSDEGKRLLFRSTNHMSHADALDDIATVAQRIKRLNTFANPSGTGQTVASASGVAGMFMDPFTVIGSIVSTRVLSHILAKPATARAMSGWSIAYEKAIAKPTAASAEAFRQASKVLASSITREVGRPDLVNDLGRQLQGSVKAGAGTEGQGAPGPIEE